MTGLREVQAEYCNDDYAIMDATLRIWIVTSG